MSQSLSNILVHLVFSTKDRRPLLREGERGQLHAYITGILKNHDSPLLEINSVADHIPNTADSAQRTTGRSMNGTRGIELVPPLQGGGGNLGARYLGLRRCAPPPQAVTSRAFSPRRNRPPLHRRSHSIHTTASRRAEVTARLSNWSQTCAFDDASCLDCRGC